MNSNSGLRLDHHILHTQLYNLRGKLKSVHEYSERNFNHLSKRLKVYFEEIREIAADTALMQDAVECVDLANSSSLSEAFTAEESKDQLRSLFYTFQIIQNQCWKLKKDIEAERNAFRTLAEKACLHIFTTDDSFIHYTEATSHLEEQMVGLDSLNRSLENLVKPISQSVNALFFINKFFDLADSSSDDEVLDSSSAATLIVAISKDAELCLDDINKLATNIQIHDLVRQRLEHIDQVYEQLLHELASSEDKGFTPKYLSMIPELARLHIAQLDSIKKECLTAFSVIRNVLNTIDERMTDALESYVKVSCLCKHLDADFNQKVEGLLSDSFATIAGNEQKYLKAVGDLQASFRGLKIGQLKIRSSVVDYLNASAIRPLDEGSNGTFQDEMEAHIAVMRNAQLKFGVEVSNAIQLFAEVANLMEFVDDTYGNSHEAFYNESVYQLYAKKCSSKDRKIYFSGLSDEENTREVHGKYTDFFSKKISEVAEDLAKLSRQPWLVNSSKEHILQRLSELEKTYTMQSEREVHRRIYPGVAGNASGAYSSTMAEYAAGEDNLELF